MTTEAIIFLAGGVFLLIALAGGGTYGKVQLLRLSPWARSICAVVGLAFIVLGFSVYLRWLPEGLLPTAASIRFQIVDALEANQQREEVDVLIDGRLAGSLSLSRGSKTEDRLVLTLPAKQSYQYRLQGYTWFGSGDHRPTSAC